MFACAGPLEAYIRILVMKVANNCRNAQEL